MFYGGNLKEEVLDILELFASFLIILLSQYSDLCLTSARVSVDRKSGIP